MAISKGLKVLLLALVSTQIASLLEYIFIASNFFSYLELAYLGAPIIEEFSKYLVMAAGGPAILVGLGWQIAEALHHQDVSRLVDVPHFLFAMPYAFLGLKKRYFLVAVSLHISWNIFVSETNPWGLYLLVPLGLWFLWCVYRLDKSKILW